VKAHQAEHAVERMCGLLGVSTSGYYAWLQRPPSDRELSDRELTGTITDIWEASDRTYGAPRVHAELADDRGIRVGKKRVARLMRAAGIQGVSRRKWVRTTVKDDRTRPAPDLVQRQFTATAPNQIWVADITFIPTWEGWVYLAAVQDMWSRRIVGWAMADHMRTELVAAALDMAIQTRRPSGVVHHSDQGSQYTSVAFGMACHQAGVIPSMGSTGDCYDNAMAESFFATLKTERVHRRSYHTRTEAINDVFTWIEGRYNPKRRHSALGHISPTTFERRNWPHPP
jgi:putative transposase